MTTFAREILFEVIDEIQPLLALHYAELARNKDRVKLEPMWERYAHAEASGRDAFQIYTARDEQGVLVGYAAFFVQPHMHYRELFPAINDVIFVHPQHRDSTGLRLIRFCERELQKYAHKIVFHVKLDTPMAALLPRLGYALEEHVYGKFL
jgi:L-amino acid N-acyltransferase YncA